MLRRLALALIGVIVATFALAQTPSKNILRMNAGVHPTYYCNYTNGSFCGGESYSGPSLRTITDATGAITYAPNVANTYSEDFTQNQYTLQNSTISSGVSSPLGSSQTLTDTTSNTTHGFYWIPLYSAATGTQVHSIYAKAGTVNYIEMEWNSAGATMFNLSTGTVVSGTGGIISVGNGWYRCYIGLYRSGTGQGVKVQLSPDGVNIVYTVTGTGTVYLVGANSNIVTYQTTPAPYVKTTTAQYYGPAFDINTPSAGAYASGLRDEAAATNLYLNSKAPATQTITVVDGTTYTGSILGTGTQAFTGAFTATLIGTANTLTQTTQAAATVTSLVATDTSLTATAYPQVEVGSFATSRIITGASSVTRAADTIGVTGLLAALVVTNPIIVERQSIATGVISRTLYAKNTFAFANGYWYRKLAAYPTTTPTTVLNQIAAMQRPMP